MINVKKMQYFVGKPCTVFTTPINRNYKDENPNTFPQQLILYFTGIVESIDDSGVWMRQLTSSLKSFWFLPHIVGLSEEELLDPEKDAAEIEGLKKAKEKARSQLKSIQTGDGPYVDAKALLNISNQLKKT